MPFEVRDPAALKTLVPGATVRFTTVERGHEEYAEQLQTIKVTNFESEPTEAGRLTVLHRALDPAAVRNRSLSASRFRIYLVRPDKACHAPRAIQGKSSGADIRLFALPQPELLLRLSNNLSQMIRRFPDLPVATWCLVTIVIDPDDGSETKRWRNMRTPGRPTPRHGISSPANCQRRSGRWRSCLA